MKYEATVEFKFHSTCTDYRFDHDGFLPEENFVISAPATELHCRQYFKLFEKFMLAVGMSPANICKGAMSLAYNEMVSVEDQRKICDEYDLTLNEDLHEKFEEWKERDKEIERLNNGCTLQGGTLSLTNTKEES